MEHDPSASRRLSSAALSTGAAPNPPKRPMVLLVEPDAETRTLIRLAIRKSYEVMAASSEAEAVVALQSHPADIGVIILDVTVAGSNGGPSLTPSFRRQKLGRDVPVIVTGADTLKDEIRAHCVGCYAYLPKPFYPRELLSLLEDCVPSHGGEIR